MINKCNQCSQCCYFLISLSEEEYKSGKYKTEFKKFHITDDFQKAIQYGANILKQNKNSSCIYLKKKRCSDYETRPQVCRDYFCSPKLKKS